MTKDQEILTAVLLDYLHTSQKEARASKAVAKAILHLIESLNTKQLESLIDDLKGERK